MNIECPKCRQVAEVPFEMAEGQHVRCPYCGVKFAYSGDGSYIVSEDRQTGFTNGIKAKPYVILGSVIVLIVVAIVIGCMVLSDQKTQFGNYGLVAEKAQDLDGQEIIQISIPRVLMSDSFGGAFSEGLLLSVSPRTKRVNIRFGKLDEESNIVCYFDLKKYDIMNDSDWDRFRDERFVLFRRQVAEELYGFVENYR